MLYIIVTTVTSFSRDVCLLGLSTVPPCLQRCLHVDTFVNKNRKIKTEQKSNQNINTRCERTVVFPFVFVCLRVLVLGPVLNISYYIIYYINPIENAPEIFPFDVLCAQSSWRNWFGGSAQCCHCWRRQMNIIQYINKILHSRNGKQKRPRSLFFRDFRAHTWRRTCVSSTPLGSTIINIERLTRAYGFNNTLRNIRINIRETNAVWCFGCKRCRQRC